MDKRLKRTFLAWHAQGLSATDVMIRHNKDPRREYDVHAVEVADVLKQMGAKDPYRRIEQKHQVQPDMPKRFMSIYESTKKRQKLTLRKKVELTAEQRKWHNMSCGLAQNGQKLLKSRDYKKLEQMIVDCKADGYEQIGGISADFYYDGDTYLAVMKKKEDAK